MSEQRRDDEAQRVPDRERGHGQQQEHHGDRGEPPLALGAVHGIDEPADVVQVALDGERGVLAVAAFAIWDALKFVVATWF